MLSLFKKRPRNAADQQPDSFYRPRASTTADAVRPYNNAKPMFVDTQPTVVDASDSYAASFHYREGRDPAHQYSRVTVPLNFNPTFMSLAKVGFTPGAKLQTEAQIAVPRNQNRGMQAINPRANQYRPAAGSYGSQSENSGTVSAVSPMMKWA